MFKKILIKLGIKKHLLADLALATPESNLVRFAVMRTVAWLGFLGLSFFGVNTLNFDINLLPILLNIGFMLLLNVFIWFRLKTYASVTDIEYLLYLLVDTLGIAILFYFTGGANNPFIFYFLLPLTVSAATLPLVHTWILALTTVVCYSFLLSFYRPVEAFVKVSDFGIQIHVLGMWLNFLLSVILITIFIVNMASVLRQRDRDMASTREKTMYDEQIMTIATQAAGTAHELGTPLSTMAIILKELEYENSNNKLLSEDLTLLRQQVDICKSKLQKLVNKTAQNRVTKFLPRTIGRFMQKTLSNWQDLYPNANYELNCKNKESEKENSSTVYILSNFTLEQALINLLNNAWTASSQKKIHISIFWDKKNVCIEIHNLGAGIPLDLMEKLGKSIVNSGSDGMGLGLFLTHATINRQKGTVKLYNHPKGGILTQVCLPRYKHQEDKKNVDKNSTGDSV